MNRRNFLRTAGLGVAAAIAPPLSPQSYFIGHMDMVRLVGSQLANTFSYARDPTRYGYTLSRAEVERVRALAYFNPSGYLIP